MDKLITKLNGDRAKRVASKNEQNASILNIVQLFQEEEERAIMVKMAEMQKQMSIVDNMVITYEQYNILKKEEEFAKTIGGLSEIAEDKLNLRDLSATIREKTNV